MISRTVSYIDQFQELKVTAPEAAQRLLGCEFIRELDGKMVRVRIVETEAYDQTDPASHAYKGITPRSHSMFEAAGHLYVYFTYGMHYCCNVVAGEEGYGAGVLIRAVEPLEGGDVLAARRLGRIDASVSNGPGKLCQALGIDKSFDGHYLVQPPLQLLMQPALNKNEIVTTTRIGISQATDTPWRYYVKGNQYVSRSPRIVTE